MARIRAASFNIQHGRARNGRIDLQVLTDACAGLAADVLCLQEVDAGVRRSGRVDQAAEIARAAGMAHAFAPALRPRGGGGYGNALCVRGGIDDAEIVALPRGRDEPRAALVATASVNGAALSVAATHLAVFRDEALDQLDAVLAGLRRRSAPHLLLGDLNLTPEDVRERAEASGLTLAGGADTFPADRPRVRIDHAAVSGLEVTQVAVVETPVSDHRALVVDLETGAR